MTIASNPSSAMPDTNPSLATAQTFEVNIVQTTSSKWPWCKKKNKGKDKKTSSKKGGEQTQQLVAKGNKNKCKFKYASMVCKEDNFTKWYPLLFEVYQYLERGRSSS